MENNIIISNLNDFTFCPRSIYFHNIYDSFDESLYHDTFQVEGRNVHESIDEKKYSTKKNWIQGLSIYSEELGVIGKIDLFNSDTGLLVERKKYIKKIYYGYILQLYAQFFCLTEMGFEVKKLQFYSFSDNKKYDISLPTKEDKEKLLQIIRAMKSFDIQAPFSQNTKKCEMCIYNALCDYYQNDE